MKKNTTQPQITAAQFFALYAHQRTAESQALTATVEAPLLTSEQWDATASRWYVVRQWTDGRITREVL